MAHRMPGDDASIAEPRTEFGPKAAIALASAAAGSIASAALMSWFRGRGRMAPDHSGLIQSA